MPELRTLLADEAVRRQPAELPPFGSVRSHARRRMGVRVAAAALAVAAATWGAFALVGPAGEPLPNPHADSVSSPGRFESATLSFDYPTEWTALVIVDQPRAYVQTVVSVSSDGFGCALEPGGERCVVDLPRLSAGGVFLEWVRHDPPGRSGSLDFAAGEETRIDSRQAWINRSNAEMGCAEAGGAREVNAVIRLAGFSWLSMSACLAAPAEETEQQVLDMLASVTIPGGRPEAQDPEQVGTGRFESPRLDFDYPPAWSVQPASPSSTSSGQEPLAVIRAGDRPDLCPSDQSVPEGTAVCADGTVRLDEGGISGYWFLGISPDPLVISGEESTVDGLRTVITAEPDSPNCDGVDGGYGVNAWIEADPFTHLTFYSCLAAPTAETEQRVRDMIASVGVTLTSIQTDLGYISDQISFEHPPEWTVTDAEPDTVEDGTQPLVVIRFRDQPERCEGSAPPKSTAICANGDVVLDPGGVSASWEAFDSYGAEVAREGEQITVDGRPGYVESGPAADRCPGMADGRELRVLVEWDIDRWYRLVACLTAPTEPSEQQVLDMLDSVDLRGD